MKKSNHSVMIIVSFLLGSLLLSACTGGAGLASSWPGLLVDPQSETIYMAHNTHVYAVNLVNGVEKWRFPEKPDNKKQFFAPPVMTEDGQIIEGAYDNILYSLNPQNGQQTWTFTGANDKYIGPALTYSGGIYAPNSNTILYALDDKGGSRWKFTTDHALWAQPISDGRQIYVASMDHSVYAVNPDNGSRVWVTQDLGGAITHSFSYNPDGILYVGTLGAKMSAVSTQDGKVLWQTPVEGWVWSKAVLADQALFFGDQDGHVYALDSQSGQVKWQIQPDTASPDRAFISTPVVISDTLYIASQAGMLYAFNKEDGKDLWGGPKTIGGKIYSDLVTVKDTIILSPLELDKAPVTLIALDLQGKQLWSYIPAK